MHHHRYKSVEDFKIEDIGSIKRVEENLGSPSIQVFESSKLSVNKSEKDVCENGWRKLGDRTMRQVQR